MRIPSYEHLARKGTTMNTKQTTSLTVIATFIVVFAASASSQTILPYYETILNEMEGYAKYAGCTGGKGGPLITVSNETELRDAVSGDSPKWVRFDPGLILTISIGSPIYIGSNTTLDGRGANITIVQDSPGVHGFFVRNESNVIITHIKMDNWEVNNPNDAQCILIFSNTTTPRDRYWIYKCSFTRDTYGGDDMVGFGVDNDLYARPTKGTVQSCYFYQLKHAIIVGWNFPNDDMRITVCKNAFEWCGYRCPNVCAEHVHTYNNYINNFKGWTSSQVYRDGRQFAEYNVYTDADESPVVRAFDWNDEGTPGAIRHVNCWYESNCYENEVHPEWVGAPPYSYSPITTNSGVKSQTFGWQDVPWPPCTSCSAEYEDFCSTSFSAYGSENVSVDIIDGCEIALTGNTWIKMSRLYNVTAATRLDFEFRSTNEGEIQGIALDNDNSHEQEHTFKVYGTQDWGIQDYDNYSGTAWKSYNINAGAYFSGHIEYLCFINNNDEGSGNAHFRYVKLYEIDTDPPTVAFTQPTETTITEPADLGVVAEATAPGGSIDNVKLYLDDTFVRQENNAPYEWGTASATADDSALLGLTAGTYTLRVVATDANGTTASDTMEITVEPAAVGVRGEALRLSPVAADHAPQVFDLRGRRVVRASVPGRTRRESRALTSMVRGVFVVRTQHNAVVSARILLLDETR